MPTTYTHHIFGALVYQKLPKKLQETIQKEKNLYEIGLHGPDILFYYRPFQNNRVNGLGHGMHREEALGFFRRAKEQYQNTKEEALLAYITGFICHFMLDSACHPIVSDYMKKEGSSHAEIETDLDRVLMEKTHKNPVRYRPADTVRIRGTDAAVIASVLEGMDKKTILSCLRGMKFYTNLTICSSEWKRKMLLLGMKITGADEELKGRMMEKRRSRRCEESTQELIKQMKRCVPETVRMIESYWNVDGQEDMTKKRFSRNYL